MYVRVGELKRPLSIRYAYVLTRLHFHSFGCRLFVGSLRILLLFDGAAAIYVYLYIYYIACVYVFFSFQIGRWLMGTNNRLQYIFSLYFARGYFLPHKTLYTCVCLLFFILTFACPYLVIMLSVHMPTNQPTNRQS